MSPLSLGLLITRHPVQRHRSSNEARPQIEKLLGESGYVGNQLIRIWGRMEQKTFSLSFPPSPPPPAPNFTLVIFSLHLMSWKTPPLASGTNSYSQMSLDQFSSKLSASHEVNCASGMLEEEVCQKFGVREGHSRQGLRPIPATGVKAWPCYDVSVGRGSC